MNAKLFFLSLCFLIPFYNLGYAQWKHTNNMIDGKYITSLTSKGNKVFAGTGDGLYLSTDNGDHWKAINHGLPKKEIWALATTDTTIIAGTWGGGIFLCDATDTNWIYSGLDMKSIDDILINNTNIYVANYGEGIYVSGDGGKTWTSISNGLADKYVHAIVMSGTNLIAGTSSGIYISGNNGTNWTSVVNGISNADVRGMIIKSNTVFAATCGTGIFVSKDSGMNWDSVNTGLSENCIWSFAISGNNIFAGSYGGGGIFLSTDNGLHWKAINDGLTNNNYVMSVMSLCVTGTDLYAGTHTGGVWKRALSDFTGINPYGTKNENPTITIFPNPSSGITNIDFGESYSETEIKIENILGQEVMKTKYYNTRQIQLQLNQDPGIYFFTITIPEGKSYVFKVVKD